MGFIRDLFGLGPSKREKLLTEEVERTRAQAEAEREEMRAQLAALAERLEKEAEKVEPRCEIVMGTINDHDSVRFEMDWNDEFVDMLRDHGFTGTDDEDIVNQYLNAIMARHTRPEMVANGIDRLDRESESYYAQS